MDDGVSTRDTMLDTQSDFLMDLDYMDELLLEGSWLETADGSEFLHHIPSDFDALFDSPFNWPALEDRAGVSPSKGIQEERQRSSFTENLSVSQSDGRDSSKRESIDENVNNALCSSSQSGNTSAEPYELGRRKWIGPRPSADPA